MPEDAPNEAPMEAPGPDWEPQKPMIHVDPALFERVREGMTYLLAEGEAEKFEAELIAGRGGPFYRPPKGGDQFTQMLFDALLYRARNKYNERKEVPIDFIRRNIGRVVQGLANDSSRHTCTEALLALAENVVSQAEKKVVATALQPHLEDFLGSERLLPRLPVLMQVMKREEQEHIAKKCVEMAKPFVAPTGIYDNAFTRAVAWLCGYHYAEVRTQARECIATAIPEWFDAGDVFEAWTGCKEPFSRRNSIISNINVIHELEGEERGMTKSLYREFGIRCFNRYDRVKLLKQYHEKDDTSKKYGVVVYPLEDDSGAFQQDKSLLSGMDDDLSKLGCESRIIEAGSIKEMRRRCMQLYKKYYHGNAGPHAHKFSFVLVGGHGSPSSITLGWGERLTKRDASGYAARRLKEASEEGAEMTLFSCSTGAEGGIAELASKSALVATGPEADTGVRAIHVEKANTPAGVVLRPEYTEAVSRRYAA